MVLLTIEPQSYKIIKAEALRGPWSVVHQKNWMPMGVVHGRASWLYRAQPPLVLDLEIDRPNDSAHGVSELDAGWDAGYLRGGSQLIRVWHDGGWHWLGLVHEVCFPGGASRIYSHRFVLYDDKQRLVGMSDPFFFKHRGIEFCAGLTTDGGQRLIASFSVEDSSAYLATFEFGNVMRAIRKDYVV